MKNTQKKIMFVFGTRPEAIKMAPLINELIYDYKTIICVTAQHREMLDDVLSTFDIKPDYDLNLMKPGQDLYDITSKVLMGIKDVLKAEKPDLLLVHGDTTTTFASSLAAFYFGCRVGHVEAGLRTHNLYSPYPEELNRQIVSKLTHFHFCPTINNMNNLLAEKIDENKIAVTGNTVIDALLYTAKELEGKEFSDKLLSQLTFLENKNRKMILVTGHRRENFGEGFKNICKGLLKIAQNYLDIEIVYPVHLNPNVADPVNKYLKNQKNIHLIQPQSYISFIQLMSRSFLILTDSGGIQEEAPSLGKPVLVMRDTSERMEAVDSGTVKLVGTDAEDIYKETANLIDFKDQYESMISKKNPYGDGTASIKIKQFIDKVLK